MKMIANIKFENSQNQRGAVLVFALILLTVLSLVGVSANRDIILQERMTGNDLDSSVSLQAAEAALRIGEAEIGNCAPYESDFNGGKDGYYRIDANDGSSGLAPYWEDAVEYPHNDSSWLMHDLSNVSQDPRYMIVLQDDPPVIKDLGLDPTEIPQKAYAVRILAQGYGTSAETDTVVETIQYSYNCGK